MWNWIKQHSRWILNSRGGEKKPEEEITPLHLQDQNAFGVVEVGKEKPPEEEKPEKLAPAAEEDLKKRAEAVGLEGEVSEEDIVAREDEAKAEDLKKRATEAGLAEDASLEDVEAKEQEIKDADFGNTPIDLEKLAPEMKKIVEAKGFKTVGDLFKWTTELEKSKTISDQQRSDYRNQLAAYANFDADGKITGLKDGVKILTGKEEAPRPGAPAGPALSPEEAREKFMDSFDKDPVGVVMGLAMLVATQLVDSKGLDKRFAPLESDYSDRQLDVMVDKVAADSKDVEFFEEHEDAIAAEIKKIPAEKRKSDPEGTVRQAYLQVKTEVLKNLRPKEDKKPAGDKDTTLERPGKGAKKTKKDGSDVFEGMAQSVKTKGAFV